MADKQAEPPLQTGKSAGRTPPDVRPDDTAFRQAQQIAQRLRRVVYRMPRQPTCFVQAMAGYLLLRRQGLTASIRLSVRKIDGKLTAHAWQLSGDQVILGAEGADAYTPLTDLGEKR